MTESNQHWAETEKMAALRIEQANSLLEKVNQGSGMSFDAFVTSDLAQWLLEKVKHGDFVDPGEAIYYLLQEVKELEPHQDLRQELLKRQLEESSKGPFLDGQEVMRNLQEKMNEPLPETVTWKTIKNKKKLI